MPTPPNEEVSARYIPNASETYDEWFQRQVEIGFREAEDPNTVWYTNEEVFRDLDERRKEWRAQAEKQRDVA